MSAARPKAPLLRRPLFWGAVMLALSTLFLAYDIASHPIVLWDESRVVSNALEMSRTGFSLITTYDFKPDLWNTKPPLAIWLIAGSIRLFGFSDWAVRLPALLAVIATVALVMGFTWRLTRSAFVTVWAIAFLVFSAGYFGVHVAQSADYEALLCLFVTAYLLLLFEVIHRRRPGPLPVLVLGLLVALACLTKGVAGLIPGVGVALYVVVRGRWPRLFKTPWYVPAGLIIVALAGGFYLAREHMRPGYLSAVAASELSGRFLQATNGHVMPAYYYLQMLWTLFASGPALLLLLVAPLLRWPRTRSAAFLTYGAFVVVAMIAVLSAGQTKLFWYVAPLYPVLAIMLAIVLGRLLLLLPNPRVGPVRLRAWLVAVLAADLLAGAFTVKLIALPKTENNPQGRYGAVFAELQKAGYRRIRTLDGGVENDDKMIGYTPQLHIYSLVWRARGLAIGSMSSLAALQPGEVAVTCDARFTPRVRALGAPLTSVPDCAATKR